MFVRLTDLLWIANINASIGIRCGRHREYRNTFFMLGRAMLSENYFSEILLILCVVAIATDTTTISTGLGDITGMSGRARFAGQQKPFLQFLGIPYAMAPVGENRFAKPRPISSLPESPYNATFPRSPCPGNPNYDAWGLTKTSSEDCLHLNMYVPGDAIDVRKRFAVMVWIHGGGFFTGSSDSYNGEVMSAFNDVIVVTFNYRLSVFGFLSSGDTGVSGNYGLWDQHLAIRWVRDNIGNFGGDENTISIIGESAGAASVIYQSVYQGNEGLFRRVIAESGSSLSPWAYQRDPETNFWAFARSAGCRSFQKVEVVECLRNLSTNEILSVVPVEDPFRPSSDGDIVHRLPSDSFSSHALDDLKHFRKLDLLMGVNNKEGLLTLMINMTADGLKFNDLGQGLHKSTMVNEIIPKAMEEMNREDNVILKTAITHQYSDWTDPESSISVRDSMIDFLSDVYYYFPTLLTINGHHSFNSSRSTFLYEFTHQSPYDTLMSPAWLGGANHGAEMNFVFGFAGIGTDYIPAEERNLSLAMMKLWTNFAKFGNPNIDGVLPYQWPEYDDTTMQYLDISANVTSQQSVKTRMAAERMAFWQYLASILVPCEPVCKACGVGTVTSSVKTLHPHVLTVPFVMYLTTTRIINIF